MFINRNAGGNMTEDNIKSRYDMKQKQKQFSIINKNLKYDLIL